MKISIRASMTNQEKNLIIQQMQHENPLSLPQPTQQATQQATQTALQGWRCWRRRPGNGGNAPAFAAGSPSSGRNEPGWNDTCNEACRQVLRLSSRPDWASPVRLRYWLECRHAKNLCRDRTTGHPDRTAGSIEYSRKIYARRKVSFCCFELIVC